MDFALVSDTKNTVLFPQLLYTLNKDHFIDNPKTM